MDTPVYLKNINLQNIKCFEGLYSLALSNKDESPNQWTVILGNNNTGKTTILKSIACLQSVKSELGVESDDQYPTYIPFVMKIRLPIQEVIGTYRQEHLLSEISSFLFICNEFFEEKRLEFHSYTTTDNPWYVKLKPNESIGKVKTDKKGILKSFLINAYGTSRRTAKAFYSQENALSNSVATLLFDNGLLVAPEEWLKNMHFAITNSEGDIKNLAEKRWAKIKQAFLSGLLPEIQDIRVRTDINLNNHLEFFTGKIWVGIESLGYGYQSTINWVVDLAKRMFDRYPNLDNPLHGPAIVLVDEIDLHLHPEWQRKIIKYLSDLFPNTQFIVTAHSPLIVQSAENVNLIMLEKDDETGSINVRQQFGSFQGWTVEEILRELMDMGEKTRSDRYLELMRQFEDGLLVEDYEVVKSAYDELDKILSPSSHQRKVLQIQMSSLIPA